MTRPRPREAGIVLGTLEPGPLNAITDVPGVRVGHVTIVDGGSESGGAGDPPRGPARTGVTVVLPHGGNLFREKVPAAFHVINGFGKAPRSRAWSGSTARRIPHVPAADRLPAAVLPEDGPLIDVLFQAVTESAEEAVVSALLAAEHVGGPGASGGVPLPVGDLLARLGRG